MKTELLALIENYGKALVYQTEGKISAFKDARNLMSDIVFLLDKAEREEAAIGAGGVERLRSDAPAAVEPVANCYSDNDGESWRDRPDDFDFIDSLKLGDEFELQASVRAWPETFRVTKVPDEASDDYEVEPVLIRSSASATPAEPADALTHTELLEIRRAAEDFESHGETDVDDELLIRGALAGYLECTHFQLLNESALELDIQYAAQAAQKNGGA